MLTTAEKRRLRLSLPQTVTAEYTAEESGSIVNRSTVVDPNYLWVGADTEGTEDDRIDDYPVVFLQWQSLGGDVANEELLSRFAERVFDDNFDPDTYDADSVSELFDGDTEVFKTTYETRMEAELQITPVVETKWVDGVPPQPRAEAMARQCWRWVTFRGSRELNGVGPNGERPLVVEQSGSPTPARQLDTYRTPMTALVRHTESFREVVPVVQDEEINTESESQ